MAAEQCTVVNIRKANLKKLGYKDFTDWNSRPNTLYVGRNMTFYVPGTKKSKWCNPFSAKKMGREKCIEEFEKYLKANKDLMDALPELQNKQLGCWCSPEACHADVLAKMANKLV